MSYVDNQNTNVYIYTYYWSIIVSFLAFLLNFTQSYEWIKQVKTIAYILQIFINFHLFRCPEIKFSKLNLIHFSLLDFRLRWNLKYTFKSDHNASKYNRYYY